MALGSVGGPGASMVARRYAMDGLATQDREQQRTQAQEAAKAEAHAKPPVEATQKKVEATQAAAGSTPRVDMYL